ncbi:MAG: DUF1501 domain-containing protein [Sandaracinaceae bacterium]|nr:DUF1501 domain-containing protein [Sandaracinaceae bacterium]
MRDQPDTRASRRNFLKGVLFAGGGAALGAGSLDVLARLARGQEDTRDRFYVFAYFSGGWDTLLSLDPRDPATFGPDAIGGTRIMPGYEQLATPPADPLVRASDALTFGPFVGELASLASRTAVIRGMSMDTLTHEVGRRRFLTGKVPSGLNARGSSGSAWIASQFGTNRLIPNLSVRVEAFNPELGPDYSALRVSRAEDLVAMLQRATPVLAEPVDEAVDAFLTQSARCSRATGSPMLRAAEASRRRMRTVLAADVQSLFDFRANTPEMEALRSHFGFTATTSDSPGGRAAIAAQALVHGVARCVTIEAAGGLDTHFDEWSRDQGPRQQAGFDALARLARYLEGVPYDERGSESMLDRTVIVGFSEFMRTPLLNARGGRDHWLTNSCFLLGGPFRGDQAIGASSDVGMAPQPVDLATGRLDPGGVVIRPENVLRTLLVDAGLADDRADLRADPIGALLRS